jgi:uncharacterized protein YhdP
MVSVRVNEGKYRDIPISAIEANVKFQENKMFLEQVAFKSGKGHGTITGWFGFEEGNGLSFELRPHLVSVEAGPILASFQREGSMKELTGPGSFSGVVSGHGKDFREIVESIDGTMDLFLVEGRVAQFSTLSKIFSLLDLSQVLRGNLPDLKAEGLRYEAITGNIHFKRGVAWTDDLLLDSDSMKIATVGSLDILPGHLNLYLGIRRVGIVGTIVRQFPFLGKIVTKDGGSFLIYYLEVKGNISQPEVRVVPMESVRDGLFGPLSKLVEKPTKILPTQKGADSY